MALSSSSVYVGLAGDRSWCCVASAPLRGSAPAGVVVGGGGGVLLFPTSSFCCLFLCSAPTSSAPIGAVEEVPTSRKRFGRGWKRSSSATPGVSMGFAGTVVLVGDEAHLHRLGDRLQRVVILKWGLERTVLVKLPQALE